MTDYIDIDAAYEQKESKRGAAARRWRRRAAESLRHAGDVNMPDELRDVDYDDLVIMIATMNLDVTKWAENCAKKFESAGIVEEAEHLLELVRASRAGMTYLEKKMDVGPGVDFFEWFANGVEEQRKPAQQYLLAAFKLWVNVFEMRTYIEQVSEGDNSLGVYVDILGCERTEY